MKIKKSSNQEESRWEVGNEDGQFYLDRIADGALVIVDSKYYDPHDEGSEGILYIDPEDAEKFIAFIKAALEQYESGKENPYQIKKS